MLGLVLLLCSCDKVSNDEEKAEAVVEHVAAVLSPEELDARYSEAIAKFTEEGESSRADVRKQMQQLASLTPGSTGHAGAYLWVANDLLRTVNHLPPKLRTHTRQSARSHLERSVELDPAVEEPYRLLAQLLMQEGKPEEAITLLNGKVEDLPGLSVLLAWLYSGQKNEELAERFAIRGAEHWKGIAEAEPENSQPRLRWARALMILKKEEEVFSILDEGREHGNEKLYDQFEFSLRMKHVMTALNAEPPRPGEAIELVEVFLEKSPKNAKAINKLYDIAARFPEFRPRVRSRLIALSEMEGAPMGVHAVLGKQALDEDDFASALPHLEKAFELAPKSPFVAIHLAWSLSKVQPPQFQRARTVIDSVQPGFRSNPLVQRTRGRILVRMGNYKEGVDELLKALPSIEPKEQIEAHELLAEAYTYMGERELAAEHRRKANPREVETSPDGVTGLGKGDPPGSSQKEKTRQPVKRMKVMLPTKKKVPEESKLDPAPAETPEN